MVNMIKEEELQNAFIERVDQEDARHIKEKYYDEVETIIKGLVNHEISLPKEVWTAFANHVVVMFMRVDRNEQLHEQLPHESDQQVSKLAKSIASEILLPIENSIGVKINEFEFFLFALYIEISINQKGGEEQ